MSRYSASFPLQATIWWTLELHPRIALQPWRDQMLKPANFLKMAPWRGCVCRWKNNMPVSSQVDMRTFHRHHYRTSNVYVMWWNIEIMLIYIYNVLVRIASAGTMHIPEICWGSIGGIYYVFIISVTIISVTVFFGDIL